MSELKNDDHISNPRHRTADSIAAISERRFSRRNFLKASLATGAVGSGFGLSACNTTDLGKPALHEDSGRLQFNFIEIAHGVDETHHVAPDHTAELLIRWGDPLFPDSPEFDLNNQTAESQSRQFGYNNDYIGYLELTPEAGQQQRALLCINHEYAVHGLMFPNYPEDGLKRISKDQVGVSQAAVGGSIVEIVKIDDQWSVNTNSKYNRRITAHNTAMTISGPAAGHSRMQTNADPSGTAAIGTMNNCAGGMTPWGTYLTCEENINYHFGGQLPDGHAETLNHKRMNVPSNYMNWAKHDSRFDVGVEPNEPNRFGWVVEIDPLDPNSTPIKRTAMGRFKHEGGENVLNKDGRLVVYMGDDQRFEYLYKFVSRDKVNQQDRAANANLLDHGTLYVAKFHDDGSMQWLPVSIENELIAAEFATQADVMIDTRRAADLLGATPMDRPEDVVPNPETGKIYVMLTNNTRRTEPNVANPRVNNAFGHIIEITEPENDFSSIRASWEMLIKAGDPSRPEVGAQWNSMTSENGWFASPDNGVIDPSGRLWVSTDQGEKVHMSGTNDGLWAMETVGERRGTGKMFFRVPNGAELCGPEFSKDGETLFVAVQHPGDFPEINRARVENASTRWPDFDEVMPPRPSVMVIQRKGGGRVG